MRFATYPLIPPVSRCLLMAVLLFGLSPASSADDAETTVESLFDVEKMMNSSPSGDALSDVLGLIELSPAAEQGIRDQIDAFAGDAPEWPILLRGGTRFAAGVASRSIDPESFELPALPQNGFLQFLYSLFTGSDRDRPPLAGFGRFGLDLLLKLPNAEEFYSHIWRGAEGTLDEEMPVQAKALVMVDSFGSKVAWVGTDLVGSFQDMRNEVLDRLNDRGIFDFNEGNLLIGATHTHSGPGSIVPRWAYWLATVDVFNPEVYDAVTNRIVEAIEEANSSLVAAQIGVASGTIQTPISENRRDQCLASGDPANPEPDPEIGVIRVDRAVDGKPLAVVFNFAVHPTSLGAENLRWHPDNVGYAEHSLEMAIRDVADLPDEEPFEAIFFNGAEGDVAPQGSGEFVGNTLASEVASLWDDIETTDAARFATAYCQDDDPNIEPSYPYPCRDAQGEPINLAESQLRVLKFIECPDFLGGGPGCYLDSNQCPSNEAPITIDKSEDWLAIEREGTTYSAFRIDLTHWQDGDSIPHTTRTVISTLPGEALTALATGDATPGIEFEGLKQRGAALGFDNVFVFGLAQGHISYIAPEWEYEQAGYEAGATVFGPDTAEVVMDSALSVLRAVAPNESE